MNEAHMKFKGDRGTYIVNDLTPIGQGVDTVVWVGHDDKGKQVAVKAYRGYVDLSPEGHSFYREITVTNLLVHPNILPILDYGISDRQDFGPFIITPLCTLGSLHQLQENRDFLSPAVFLPILDQIAIAIDFAHSKGVIHGDIKPENILFLEDLSHARLSDFGAARLFPQTEKVTKDDPGPGTTTYLSPEQILDNRQSPSSDIYSLALVSYESLTGRFPFDTSGPIYRQMKAKIDGDIKDPFEANRRLPSSIGQALLIGLRTDPLKRPATAREFSQLLREGAKEAEKKSKKIIGFWDSLSSTQKVALTSAAITAIVAIITALIEIVPDLLNR